LGEGGGRQPNSNEKSEEGKPKKLIGDGLALSSILKVISFMDSP